jgi:hypothetical protein
MFLESRARPVRNAHNLTSYVSRLSRQCESLDISQPYKACKACYGDILSRQCGILDISQPYSTPRSVTGISCLENVGSLTSYNPIGLQGLLWGYLI